MENDPLDIPFDHILAALVIGIGLGVMAVLVWLNVSDTEDPAPITNGSSSVGVGDPLDAPTATPSPAGATRMVRCVSASQALRAPLEAARPALDQWEVHVGAMNKLVVGELTLQQATDFWNRTRVGAQRRVERFDESWSALRRHGVDCPSPRFMAPANPALRPCVRQVAAEIRVLETARTAIRMWAEHVQHMDMLRMGMLSPEDATAMWLSMWQRGVRELDTYRGAAREAQAQEDGCLEAAQSG